jgi:hypothetical protein
VPIADENLLALQRTALAAGAVGARARERARRGRRRRRFFEAGEKARFTATVRNTGASPARRR